MDTGLRGVCPGADLFVGLRDEYLPSRAISHAGRETNLRLNLSSTPLSSSADLHRCRTSRACREAHTLDHRALITIQGALRYVSLSPRKHSSADDVSCRTSRTWWISIPYRVASLATAQLTSTECGRHCKQTFTRATQSTNTAHLSINKTSNLVQPSLWAYVYTS